MNIKSAIAKMSNIRFALLFFELVTLKATPGAGDSRQSNSLAIQANQTYANNGDLILFSCYHPQHSVVNIHQWQGPYGVTCLEQCDYDDNMCNIQHTSECDGVFTQNITVMLAHGLFGEWVCQIWTEDSIRYRESLTIQLYEPSQIDFVSPPTSVNEGAHSFRCSATRGNPPTEAFDWYLNNEPISNCLGLDVYGTCQIDIHRHMHGYVLRCVGIQLSYKEGGQDELILNVYYPPGSAYPSNNPVAVLNEEVVLECDVNDTGNPSELTYSWLFVDYYTKWDCDYSVDNILNCDVTNDCTNIISCTPSNEAGNGSPGHFNVSVKAGATIAEPPPPQTVTVYYEDDLQITCQTSGIPKPNTTWLYPVEDIFEQLEGLDSKGGTCGNLYISEKVLSWSDSNIEKRRTANGLSIECTGTNEYDSSQAITMLNVQYPPDKAELQVEQLKVDVEDSTRMYCLFHNKSKGNPLADMYHFEDSTSVCVRSVPECSVTIHSVNQNGPYTCFASNNPHSGRKHGETSNAVSIDILVPPAVVVPFGAGVIYEPIYSNASFSIICEAYGKPYVTLRLDRNGEGAASTEFNQEFYYFERDWQYDLNNGSGLRLTWLLSANSITCENVTAYDDDNYQCVANNTDVWDNGREDRSYPFAVRTRYPPMWKGSSYISHAEIGQPYVDIVCDICAYPEPNTYRWEVNGEILIHETRDVLRIMYVDRDDFTVYTCYTNNGIEGEKNFTIELREDGPPSITNFEVSETTSFSLNITWNAFRNGNNPPVNFSIWLKETFSSEFKLWSNNSQSWDDETLMSELITGLDAYRRYNILIIGVNMHPRSNMVQDVTLGMTRGEPLIEMTKTQVKGKMVTVEWLYNQTSFTTDVSSYTVTVQAAYWHKSNPEDIKLNPPDPVDATDEQVMFEDSSVSAASLMTLYIYENGIHNPNILQEPIDVTVISTSLSAGGIVGITLACLLVCIIPILLFLFYTKRLPVPSFTRKPRDESPNIRHTVEENNGRAPFGRDSTAMSEYEESNIYLEILDDDMDQILNRDRISQRRVYENYWANEYPNVNPGPLYHNGIMNQYQNLAPTNNAISFQYVGNALYASPPRRQSMPASDV